MSTERLLLDDLLDPISPADPAGENLRWTVEWDQVKEARRSDDNLPAGKLAKKERKSSNWSQVRDLATELLRTRSKDLQLATWLLEANVKLYGFSGLADGLHLVRELIVRYWDHGLYPQIEVSPEDRAGPFEWINEKLVDSIFEIPITARSDQGPDYSFLQLQDARRIGSEANYKDEDGEIDPVRKREFDKAIASGHLSIDMFDRAVKETRRAPYEELNAEFQRAHDEFKDLERLVAEKFGDLAPSLSACRSAFADIRSEISNILEKKRREEPDSPMDIQSDNANASPSGRSVTLRLPLMSFDSPASTSMNASWQEAERLVGSGQVEAGLAEMMRLAAKETTGRNRFQRKLFLAEVCLASDRDRLARTILEELAEQIDHYHLESWEASDLVGGVWTRLYGLYKRAGSGDADRADKLYERLCRLDPWQALTCAE